MSDGIPFTGAGPGETSAKFLYPSTANGSFKYLFNYRDTVNVSWESYALNSSATTLQLFYWLPGHYKASEKGSENGSLWRPLDLHTVPVNGSLAFTLDSLSVAYRDRGYFLGQWRLNFTRKDREPTSGETSSQIFRCIYKDNQHAHSFSELSASQPAPAAGGSSTASTSPKLQPPTTLTPPSSSSSSSRAGTSGAARNGTGNHGLAAGTVAGIVVGSIIGPVAVCAVSAFLIFRRIVRKRRSGASATGKARKHRSSKSSSDAMEVDADTRPAPPVQEIHSVQNNGFDVSRGELSDQTRPVEIHGHEIPPFSYF